MMEITKSDLERLRELERIAELDGYKRGILDGFCKARLTQREKIVFFLRDYGLTYANIAVILQINRKTAYEYYRRAVQKLQKSADL